MYKSLQEFIAHLKQEGELAEISPFVNPVLEIPEITDRMSKQPGGGKALLFKNTGTPFPLLINSLGSEKRICMALGVEKLDDIGGRMEQVFIRLAGEKKNWLSKLSVLPELAEISSYMPAHRSGRGACQQHVMTNPDLGILPVLKCWPGDGGRFITLPIVHTWHPETRVRNAGMYRMQIFSSTTTGMHWHRHKTGASHFDAWKKTGKKMPVAVALGGDPVYTFSATAPLPEGIDEYLLAGFLRRKKVELVQCITQEVEVPADADIIIEGYVDPNEPYVKEGPFGDHTGFYSLADDYPLFHVTCISWREGAVYPATIVGIPPQEDAWIAKATERIFLQPIRFAIAPEVRDVSLPFLGVAHNLAIVKIKKSFPGQAIKVANALWGAGQMMFTKIFMVTDGETEISDQTQVVKLLLENINLRTDLFFTRGPVDILDHSSLRYSFGGKLCLDLTAKLPEECFPMEPADESLNLPADNLMPGMLKLVKLFSGNLNLFLVHLDKKLCSVQKANDFLLDHAQGSGQLAILYTDHYFSENQMETMLWYLLNNIDPQRDIWLSQAKKMHCMVVDGTRKSKKTDNFERNWPNVIVSDEETIRNVDRIWPEIGLGEFIPSPSLGFRYMVQNDGAEVKE